MTRRNGENERVKRRYLVYLKDAKGRDVASFDAAASAIERFEEYVKRRDFRSFHIEQARGFKANLAAATNARTGKLLSASTIHATLAAVKAFFIWLIDQPGYASRIKYADAEYFNPPDNLSRTARARRFKSCPTLAQVRGMLEAMPKDAEIERRDHALVALAILPGARDRAIISFRLKHIDIEHGVIHQEFAGGSHQARKDVPHLVLPGRRRHPADCRRLGYVSPRGTGLWTRRSAVSENQGRARRRSRVSGRVS
jgi:integrase